MAKHVVIDEQECDGCQTCAELCSEVFEFDENAEVARVIDPEAEDACIEKPLTHARRSAFPGKRNSCRLSQ